MTHLPHLPYPYISIDVVDAQIHSVLTQQPHPHGGESKKDSTTPDKPAAAMSPSCLSR